jgi:glucokinase
MILAGDIGGTNARLAIFDVAGGRLEARATEIFPSRQYKTLEEIVVKFAAAHKLRVEHACFGIAGPVRNGRCETPNLAWVIDAVPLAKAAGVATARMINDLEANAYGIGALSSDDFAILNEGAHDPGGNAAVIAAGTGLGEAGLFWDGKRHRAFATEGGHADFSPTDETEAELMLYLKKQFGHASWERVLSGPGAYNIYRFLRDSGRFGEPAWFAEEIKTAEPPAAIARAALEGKGGIFAKTLEMFVSFYGAEAGNLALKTMALDGVYLGGGIAPRIIEWLRKPAFMEAFCNKGRMSALLQAVPVKVILNDRTALLGAARCAALDAGLM